MTARPPTPMEQYAIAESGAPGIYREPDSEWLPWLTRPAVASVVGALALAAGTAGALTSAGRGPVTAFTVAVLCAALVVLAAIDLKTMLLPDVIVGPLYLLVPVAGILGAAGGEFSWAQAGIALACGAGCFAVLWALAFATGGFGDGDVKLIGVLGFVLGLQSPAAAGLGALILPMALGALAAVPLMLAGRGGRTAIPFGPSLAAGTIIVLLLPALPEFWLR